MIIVNFSYYSLISLQFPVFPEDPDQTRPDQTSLDWIRLDLCPIRTLATFFKVKNIKLNFTIYITLNLQVSVTRSDSKSFFCVLHETL